MTSLVNLLRPFNELRDDQLRDMTYIFAFRMGLSSIVVSLLPEGRVRRTSKIYPSAMAIALVMATSEVAIRRMFESEPN